jgi:2-C-methyl-D-erythritol 4-phosphate cytidylyltransferase
MINLPAKGFMKKYAVIVAGGSGSRMGASRPKQFLLLNGKPVLWHTIEAFSAAYDDMQIVLVLPSGFLEEGQQIVHTSSTPSRIKIIAGGATRFHSVKNGLAHAADDAIIFVHDAVRCLITPVLIRNCYEQALQKGSAIPAIAVTDSIRMIVEGKSRIVDRNALRAVQTPQTFKAEIILPAFEQEYDPVFTDEASVVEAAGTDIFLIEGEKENIKITLPADMLLAEQVLRKRSGALSGEK